jgi:hypothetical protein
LVTFKYGGKERKSHVVIKYLWKEYMLN